MTIRREGKLRFRRSGETALSLEPDVAVRLRERGTNDDRRFDVYDSSHIVRERAHRDDLWISYSVSRNKGAC